MNKDKDSFDERWDEVLRALDARAGLEPETDDSVIKDFERTQPVALSPEFVRRVVAGVSRTRGRSSVDATQRSWWKRPAALVPVVLVIMLAAGVPIAISTWSGRNSTKELTYEEALDLVFDHAKPVETRLAAQTRVHRVLKATILAVKARSDDPEDLGSSASTDLQALAAAIAAPGRGTPQRFWRGHLAQSLASLNDPVASETVRSDALQEVLASCLVGIDAMHRSKVEGSRFAANAEIYLGYLSRHVQPP